MTLNNNSKTNITKKPSEYCYIGYKLPNPISTSLSDQEIHGLNKLLQNNTNILKS